MLFTMGGRGGGGGTGHVTRTSEEVPAEWETPRLLFLKL